MVAGSSDDDPAARTWPDAPRPDEPPAWLPGTDFDRQLPRHATPAGGWRGRLRWDPGRKGATALGVAVVAAVAAVGWWLAASRPHEVPISGTAGHTSSMAPPALSGSGSTVSAQSASVSSASVSSAAEPPSGPAAASSGAPVVVDVAGKVLRPGIYTLPSGARVYDALRAAGGARAGVSTLPLNLAAPLRDGQQIVVGVAAPPVASGDAGTGAAPSGGGASTGAATIVNLNTATLEQLEALPGVGPVMGQHILDWRAAHGQFTSIDQLREVSGIGDVRFAQLHGLVTT